MHILIETDASRPFQVVLSSDGQQQAVPVTNCSLAWVKRKMLEMFPGAEIEITGEIDTDNDTIADDLKYTPELKKRLNNE